MIKKIRKYSWYQQNKESAKRIRDFSKMIVYNILFFFYKKNSIIKKQLEFPNTIPVIIINYNQLFYLKKLVDSLQKRDFKNIIIIDNKSTYKPLLNFYDENKNNLVIERLNYNGGHKVFFENKILMNKYGKGFYFLTDPDIIPNEELPINFSSILLI